MSPQHPIPPALRGVQEYEAEPVHTLDAGNWAVIDMDTGTVIGTRVVLVPFPDDEDWRDIITSSDSEAIAYAEGSGIPLYRLHP